ncbi:MAG TPA: hypothetical protein VIM73_00850, partial [Polyangiaceae bacterium]
MLQIGIDRMKFVYDTGLTRRIFRNVRLRGTWDDRGHHSEHWSELPMRETIGPDGSMAFEASVPLSISEIGRTFHWSVRLDGPLGLDREGIVTEHDGTAHDGLFRSFVLSDDRNAEQRYYLTHVRRFGAVKVRTPSGGVGLRFALWAPNARTVHVVFGEPRIGYIANDGTGIDKTRPVIPLRRWPDGTWSADPSSHPALENFAQFDGAPYMYRIQKQDGGIAYRTDLYSRAQIGRGDVNPQGASYSGPAEALDGVVSC